MTKYRKTAEVEAMQWQPDGTMAIFEGYKYVNRRVGLDAHGVEYTVCDVGIRTKEGFMHIKPGDWIITGVEGERYACDAGIFAKTYEPASVVRPEATRKPEWQCANCYAAGRADASNAAVPCSPEEKK